MELERLHHKRVYLLSHRTFVSRMKLTPVRRRRRFSVKPNSTTKTPKVISFVKNSRLFGQRHPPPGFSVTAKARRRFSIRGKRTQAEANQYENPLIIVDLPPAICQLSVDLSDERSGRKSALTKSVLFKDPISFSNPWSRTSTEDSTLIPIKNYAAMPPHVTRSPSPAPRTTPARSASIARQATPTEFTSFPPTPPQTPASSPSKHRLMASPPLFPAQIPLLNTLKTGATPTNSRSSKSYRATTPKPEPKPTTSTNGLAPGLFVQRHEVGSSKGRRTVWYESVDPDAIDSPSVQGWLFPGDIYIHRHRKGSQAWLRDDTGDWTRAHNGSAHPTDSSLILQFSTSGEPVWVRQN